MGRPYAGLTDRQKLVLALRHAEMSDSQIGATLGIHRVSVNRLIQRGLGAIQRSPAVLSGLLTEHQVKEAIFAELRDQTHIHRRAVNA